MIATKLSGTSTEDKTKLKDEHGCYYRYSRRQPQTRPTFRGHAPEMRSGDWVDDKHTMQRDGSCSAWYDMQDCRNLIRCLQWTEVGTLDTIRLEMTDLTLNGS